MSSRLPNKAHTMEHSYWLARESASIRSADRACSVEARWVHLEFARLYRVKCDLTDGSDAFAKAIPELAPMVVSAPLRAAPSQIERRWSPQEVAVLRCLTANGETVKDMASRMRRTPHAIERQLATGFAIA